MVYDVERHGRSLHARVPAKGVLSPAITPEYPGVGGCHPRSQPPMTPLIHPSSRHSDTPALNPTCFQLHEDFKTSLYSSFIFLWCFKCLNVLKTSQHSSQVEVKPLAPLGLAPRWIETLVLVRVQCQGCVSGGGGGRGDWVEAVCYPGVAPWDVQGDTLGTHRVHRWGC